MFYITSTNTSTNTSFRSRPIFDDGINNKNIL